MQYTLIKESESCLKTVPHVLPQGSVLWPLLFIFFVNDMHNSVKYCKVNHYGDDTNLLLTDHLLKKIIRQVNCDLSLICHWFQANKFNLNSSKTDHWSFSNQKINIKYLNFKISVQKIITCRNVKYLGVTLEETLEWLSGQGTRFPIQGSYVQNHWVAARSTQPFVFLWSIKWVPEIFGNLVVKSKVALALTVEPLL